MKRQITRVGLSMALMATHSLALAFIDERTPEPPAMQATPLIASAAQTGALFEQSSTQPLQSDPNLIGAFGDKIWATPYPGPFGAMPIADAVIAQIVPVKGAVRLDGDAGLLNRKVVLASGKTRYNTLLEMAQTAGLSIDISQGNKIVITPARLGKNGAPGVAVREVPAQDASQVVVPGTELPGQGVKAQEVHAAVVPKPTWEMDRGVMLSAGLRKWFEKQGWQLIWRAKVDYQIVAPVRITDEFLPAVDKLLDAYRNANRPLVGYAHEAQRVIVVTEPGLKNSSVDRRPIAVTAPDGAAHVSE